MKTLQKIYQNPLGSSYHIVDDINESRKIAMEINQISLLVEEHELEQLKTSTQKILSHYQGFYSDQSTENKTIVYKSKQAEIKMMLSFTQIKHLHDLLKGTIFRLSMSKLLSEFKIH